MANPDLGAAVKEIMEHEQEDHCADTRLICLVEGLPEERLGELAGVLDANALLNETGGDQSLAIHGLMRGWVEADAQVALGWAEKIDDVLLRDTSREMAAIALAGTEPALALEAVRAIADDKARRQIYQTVKKNFSWNPATLADLRSRFPGEDWNETVSN